MKKHLFLLFFLSLTNFFWSQNVKILEHSSQIEFIELSKLNSQERECNLSVSPDGKTLYFSSEGHSSMGGFDIFKCELKNGIFLKLALFPCSL
jgi:hypothetical protein